ncbi:UNVERIFIED_CONTAM: putative indole-3-acetic acid-amido synthetase GH3.9 [Sesamum radiatum]|uniref:Indole-3-acetic acid-amido synthetase GH3.9 n=1 Tax=Sesamum radiatum TaxID=300843 RepID=A0AAW2W1N0_SESRA
MDGKKLEYKGGEAVKELERLTRKAGEVQEEILRKILAQNCGTEYLNKYMYMGGDVGDSVSQFKNHVPVITYKDIRPYISELLMGKTPISLLPTPSLRSYAGHSGTSAGEPKLIPSIAEDLDRRTFLYNLIMPIMNQHVPGLDEGKAMYLYFVKAEMSTPCGPARTVLTSYYKSAHFKHRPHDPFNDFISPDAAILCYDSDQSMSAMLDLIGPPDPDLAEEIEDICSQTTSWKGIICRLWPNAKYIEAVVTGSMSQYVPALKYYSDEKLPLVCPMYASSECYFGVNVNPLCEPSEVSFTLLPNMGYFEFIPLGENGSLLMDFEEEDEEEEVAQSKLVDLVHVKVGCYYELVVTTFSGLNRYRIGDVLQVTGFHNHAPQFRFICRRNVVLSIDNDKTNEEDLHRSITAAAKRLLEPRHALLVEYTSYADTSSVPGHYVIYWEINNTIHPQEPPVSAEDVEECCIAVEEGLDYVYRRCRTNDKTVGPLEIRVVKAGTFEKLMDLFIAQGGASINQYKTPRCVKSKAALKLLNANVSSCYFSPRDPAWECLKLEWRK